MIKWIENIWYHYKWFIVTALVGSIVFSFLVFQCSTKPKYDLSVVVSFIKTAISTEQVDLIKNGLIEYAEDYNGDGEINLNFINCTFDEDSKDVQYVISMRQKLQMSAMSESSAILYITDDDGFKYIDNIKADVGGFFQKINLPEFEGKALKISDMSFFKELQKTGDNVPKNLYISKRIIKDTIIATEPKVNEYELAADKYLESIKQEVIK